jgi:signal transduction histidine kinase
MIRRLKPLQGIVDACIAIAFFGVTVILSRPDRLSSGLIVIAFSAALGLRRLSPAAALGLAWVTALVQMYVAMLGPTFVDFSILGVLFSTAAYGIPPVRRAGLVSIFVGAVLGAAYIGFGNVGFVRLTFNFSSVAYQVVRVILEFSVPFALLLVLLGLPWTIGNLVRARTAARESRLAQAQAELETAIAEEGVIVEQERNRIARDMHDVVAHSLAVVIAQADGARYARATDPHAVDEALSAISSTAREALGDVRLLLGQLRHTQTVGPQPALADLDRLLDQMRGSGLTIGFEALGAPLPLGTGQQLAVYRIVQEALVNALRHADVSQEAVVHFEWTPDQLEVSITSALKSSPATAELRMGHGLAGMKERAALVGGRLSTQLGDRTFTVHAVIPASAGVLA